MKTFTKRFSSEFNKEQIIKKFLCNKFFGLKVAWLCTLHKTNQTKTYFRLHGSSLWRCMMKGAWCEKDAASTIYIFFYFWFSETTTDINTAGGRAGLKACECRPCLCICASAARVRDAVYHVNQPGVQHYLPAFVVNRMTGWREAEEDGTDRR